MNKENDDKKKSSESSDLHEEDLEVSLDIDDSESEKGPDTTPTMEDELATLQDQYIRLQAEFDNYRKRMSSRYDEVTRFASEGIILKVLDVVDNIEKALEVDFKADPDSAKSGIRGIYKQIVKILTNEQVRPIDCIGKEFDPYYQNAIQTVRDDTLPDDTVVEEFQTGYMIRDKVIRPAMVSVNRHVIPKEQKAEETEIEESTNDIDSDEKKGDN